MLARVGANSVRRLPRVSPAAVRWYSEPNQFNKKEKAHEDQYARQHEKEQLKKLKEQIEQKRKEVEALEKQHAEVAKKAQE